MEFPTHIVAAAALITNAEGKVLLVKTHSRGWDIPGGQVEVGEDLITAVKREIREESGIEAEITCLASVISNIRSYVSQDGSFIPTKVMFDFVGTAVGGEPQISDETSEVGWFDRDQVLDMIAQPNLLARIKTLLSCDGKVLYRVYSTRPYELHSERYV